MGMFRRILDRIGEEWEIFSLMAFLGAWYSTMISGSLWLDEAIYVNAASSILRGHIFVNLEHPPLAKYLIASSIGIFGETEAAARGVAIIFALGTVYLTYRISRSYSGRVASIIAATLLGVCPSFVPYALQAMLDIYLAFFVMLLLFVILSYERREGPLSEGRRRRWHILIGCAMAFVIVTKLYGIFFVIAAFVHLRSQLPRPDRYLDVRRKLVQVLLPTKDFKWMIAALVLTCFIFYIPYLSRPDLLAYYVIGWNTAHVADGHNIMVNGIEYRYPPVHTYLYFLSTSGLVLLAGLAVGCTSMVMDLRMGGLAVRKRGLLIYTMLPLVLFSLMPVKFFRYLLPLLPLAAVFTMPLLPEAIGRVLRWFDPEARIFRTKASRKRVAVGIVIILVFVTPSIPIMAARNPDLGVDSHYREAADEVASICLNDTGRTFEVFAFEAITLEYYMERDHTNISNINITRLNYNDEGVRSLVMSGIPDIVIDKDPNDRFTDQDMYLAIRDDCIRSYNLGGDLDLFVMKEI